MQLDDLYLFTIYIPFIYNDADYFYFYNKWLDNGIKLAYKIICLFYKVLHIDYGALSSNHDIA